MQQSDRKSSSVLVTGANGFVGSAVVEHCLRAGLAVRTTGRAAGAKNSEAEHFVADITTPESLLPAMSGVDSIVHAAGLAHRYQRTKDLLPFTEVNVGGTRNVARAAVRSGIRHFVLISSVNVYGPDRHGACDETAACNPEGAYSQSKLEAELAAKEIIGSTDMCLTILRPAVVYGEGDGGNIARLMRTIDRGRFVWVGSGSNHKSLVHRDDLARACVAVLKHACRGTSTYNVCGNVCTTREIVNGLANALGRGVPRWGIPRGFARATTGLIKGIAPGHGRIHELNGIIKRWLDDDVYDGTKFMQDFDFTPEIDLLEGLRREVAWYRQGVASCQNRER